MIARHNLPVQKLTPAEAVASLQTYTSRNKSTTPPSQKHDDDTNLHTATFEEDKFDVPADFALGQGEDVSESSNEVLDPEYNMYMDDSLEVHMVDAQE